MKMPGGLAGIERCERGTDGERTWIANMLLLLLKLSLLLLLLLLGLALGERRNRVLLGAAFGLRRRNGTPALHHLRVEKENSHGTFYSQALELTGQKLIGAWPPEASTSMKMQTSSPEEMVNRALQFIGHPPTMPKNPEKGYTLKEPTYSSNFEIKAPLYSVPSKSSLDNNQSLSTGHRQEHSSYKATNIA